METIHFKPATSPGTRLYAIGDIHGRADLLIRLLAEIEADAQSRPSPPRKILILLGDLVDRGADSRGVLDIAAALLDGRTLKGFEAHVLKGNHEAMMLSFLAGLDDGAGWLANGGSEAVESFALDPALHADTLRARLLDALSPDHRRVLRDLLTQFTDGDYGFAHAGVRPGVPWEEQREGDLLWIREAFTASEADFGRVIVHGHTPNREPQVRANRIGIDTRAWASGVLTCLVLEGTDRRFLST